MISSTGASDELPPFSIVSVCEMQPGSDSSSNENRSGSPGLAGRSAYPQPPAVTIAAITSIRRLTKGPVPRITPGTHGL